MASPRCRTRSGLVLLCATPLLTMSWAGAAQAQDALVQPGAPATPAAQAPEADQVPALPALEPAVVDTPAPVPVSGNRAPRAADDRLVLVQGGRATLDLFANDVDPDGDELSLLGGTSAAHGTLTFDGGVVTFSADADFIGQDSFLYVVSDSRGASSSGTVQVEVVRAPVATGPAAKPWNSKPAPVVARAPVQVARQAPPAVVRPIAVRRAAVGPVASQPRRAAAVTAPAPRQVTSAVAPMGPSLTPYVAPGARPATLPFTGGPTDVLLPLGAGLLLAGAVLSAAGRRRTP